MNSSLEIIKELRPIEGADRIELALVGNFQSVVAKGVHNVGDQVVFIQADSVLPTDREWAESYLQYAPKRVKIVKLRGVYSEGCIVPMSVVKAEHERWSGMMWNASGMLDWNGDQHVGSYENWDDVLGIIHYETPVPQISGAVAGKLPPWLPKTDAERWENVLCEGDSYEGIFTEKIDGTSMTVTYNLSEGYPRLFSRGIELDFESENIYTKMNDRYRVADLLAEYCDKHGMSLAVRGEIYGQSIQANKKNPHAGLPLDFRMYSVYNIGARRYEHFFGDIFNVFANDIPYVNRKNEGHTLTIAKAQEISERKNIGEGMVFWAEVDAISAKPIKIISKEYDGSK